MTSVPRVDQEPYSLSEIRGELGRVSRESRAYWNALSTAEFFTPLAAGAWSPADHVRHLRKSMRAVSDALRMPHVVLMLLFGRATRVSRSYANLRDDYHGVLEAGGKAGRFAPRQLSIDQQTETNRQRLIAGTADASEALESAMSRWDESEVDIIRIPHPLLGKLTVREMLFFMLYHNVHHVQGVERRRRPGKRISIDVRQDVEIEGSQTTIGVSKQSNPTIPVSEEARPCVTCA